MIPLQTLKIYFLLIYTPEWDSLPGREITQGIFFKKQFFFSLTSTNEKVPRLVTLLINSFFLVTDVFPSEQGITVFALF